MVAVQGKRIAEALRRSGVPLSSEDLATINGFHRRFLEDGLGLRFNSAGRPPQAYYPTYRDLLLETDAAGAQTNYLASEEAYQFVRSLQVRDRIIPVVGDISGPSALQAIGREMASRNERLSAFYVSNVEFYLFGQGAYTRFVTNLRSVPRAKTAVLIRSVFGRYLFAARPATPARRTCTTSASSLAGSTAGDISRTALSWRAEPVRPASAEIQAAVTRHGSASRGHDEATTRRRRRNCLR